METKFIIALICIFGSVLIKNSCCDSTTTVVRKPTMYCTDFKPQNALDMKLIMGMWFGKEVITHHDSEEGVFYYDTCIVIHLSNITDQIGTSTESFRRDYMNHHGIGIGRGHDQYHYLRLIWDERGTNLEYTLRYNVSRPGFWISSGPQTGSMTSMMYKQFSGTIQVMKVVDRHLVLTFCQNVPGSQLFTVILSREANALSTHDLQGIRDLLRRRDLSTKSIRKVCTSGAGQFQLPLIAPLLLVMILLIISY